MSYAQGKMRFAGRERFVQKEKPPEGGLLCSQVQWILRGNPCRWLWHGSGGSGRGSFIQNPVVDGEQRELQPVGNADLVIHIAQIVFDYLLRSAELRGDFFILVALHYQSDNPQFFRGKTVTH